MSLTRQNRAAHEGPKEESPEVDLSPQTIESSTRRGNKRNTLVIPVVGSGQEFAPDAVIIQGFVEQSTREEETATESTRIPQVPKANTVHVERVPRIREEVSTGEPQSHALLKTHCFLLYTILISTVFWGLLQIYTVPSLCSFHPLLYQKTLTSDLSPWTDLLFIESNMFEHLLKDMVSGYQLSIDVKGAQMKITDFRTLIRASGHSQKDLANDLTSLLNEAKKSGKDLQSFATNIGRSLARIMSIGDWALQRIKHDTSSNEHLRVRCLPRNSVEASMTIDFEEAMDVLGNTLEVTGSDIESNLNGLRRIDADLKAIRLSLGDLQDHPPTKQFERYLQGLKDLERYVDRAAHVIGSAYSLIRDTKRRSQAIRGRLLWERVSWSALNEKHIEAITVGLEILEEQRVRMKSAQEEMLTGKVQ